MKRTALLIILIGLSVFTLSAESPSVYFPSLSEKTHIYPSDSEIGLTSSIKASEETQWLAEILTMEFNLEWTEENFEKTSAKALSAVYSKILAEVLPAEDFLISKPLINADGSVSAAVRFSDSRVITFVICNNAICGMSV